MPEQDIVKSSQKALGVTSLTKQFSTLELSQSKILQSVENHSKSLTQQKAEVEQLIRRLDAQLLAITKRLDVVES